MVPHPMFSSRLTFACALFSLPCCVIVDFVNIDYEAAKAKIKDALNVTKVPELVAIYDAFDSVFERFDVITQIGLEWNCGGAQSMISPIILFFGAVLLITILQKDIFFKWAMTVRGSTVDTNVFIKKMRHAYASLLSVIMLYALQSAIVVIIKIVGSVWNVTRTCSPFDASLIIYGRVVCIIFIVVLFYTAVLVFAGVRTMNFYALTFGWISGVRYLIYLTFGQWTNSSISRFDIIARAKKFDNDDTDDDNHHETTMRLLGQSRGLIWMAFPAGVILTKCCEITNHPPLFIWGSRTLGKLPVDFKVRTPLHYRAVLWFLNVTRYVALFLGVMTGLPYCALVYLGGTVLFVIIELSLPESKPLPFEELPQEYQDSIIAQLRKQGADEDVEELLAKAEAYKLKIAQAQIAYDDRYTAKPTVQE